MKRALKYKNPLALFALGFAALACFLPSRGTLDRKEYAYRFTVTPALPSALDISRLERKVLGDPDSKVKHEPSALELAGLAAQYFQLGRALGDSTYYEKSEKAARYSLKLLASPNPAKVTLARLADSRHQFREAITLAQDAFRSSGSTEALAILVTSHLALGEAPTAAIYAEQLVEQRPTLPYLLLRALTFLQQGRNEEAEYDFKRAVFVEDLDTPFESSRLRALWARYLITKGDYVTAEKLLQESLRVWPEHALAWNIWGELEMARGHFGAAQTHFQKAFATSKETLFLLKYGEAKAAAGDMTVAKQYFAQSEKLLRQELNSSEFGHRLLLAEVLLAFGEKEKNAEAVALAKKEIENRPSSASYFVLARALQAANQPTSAIQAMRHALKSGVRNPDYFWKMSELENQTGNPVRSNFYAERARAINPKYNPSRALAGE